MGESLNKAKDDLGRALDTLRAMESGSFPEDGLRDLATRIQFARNALVQNEKKIWLRTKMGKEMLSGFGDASSKLLDALDSGSSLEEIEAALAEVELQAERVNEETRRRSMVVT